MSIAVQHTSLAAFNKFPILETRRLKLRKIRLLDAKSIFEMRKNQRINQFILREEIQSIENANQLVKHVLKHYQDKTGIGWAGVLKSNNKLIGTCGFNKIDQTNFRAEIGGEMMVDFWGQHLAQEALNIIIDFGFNNLHLHSIEAKVLPTNKSAVHLLKELGFELEATFKDRIYFEGDFHDLCVYTIFNY